MDSEAPAPGRREGEAPARITGSRVIPRPRSRKLSFEDRVLFWAFAVGLPGVVTALLLLWTGKDHQSPFQWSVSVLLILAWLTLLRLAGAPESAPSKAEPSSASSSEMI